MANTRTIASLELAKELEPTAQEMFEKLGYQLTDDSDLDYMTYKKGDIEIDFIIFEKAYHCSKQLILTWVPIKVDVDLYKAITQQMKELGWL